jgi:SAM-dependent methyltransferase
MIHDDDPIPSRELIDFIGGGDYREIGAHWFDHLTTLGQLRPTERILDVGCGVGRIAMPLTHYLRDGGSYDGFDIAPPAIDWCQQHIAARHPHFRFQHANIYNEFYNPAGDRRARSYHFPYAANTFDVVVLTSVFTHMRPQDIEHYLCEMARVLKPGGRGVITFFLINSAVTANIRAGKGAFKLPYSLNRPHAPIGTDVAYGECRHETIEQLERVIGYDERWVSDQFARCGFDLQPAVYGWWSGRESRSSFQDVVLARKVRNVNLSYRIQRALRLTPVREWLWQRQQTRAVS